MTKCWVLTEGMTGTQNQCVALAHAAGLAPEVKTIALRFPWRNVTPWIRCFALEKSSDPLQPPWPDLVIASGRKAIAPALWIKKQSRGQTKLVIVQSPVIKDKNFDLVIAPRHDDYHASNAMEITGALSLITPEILANAREDWRGAFEPMKGTRVAVLIGGDSRTHKMTQGITEKLAAQLKALVQQGISLMVTCSRRTSPAHKQFLHDALVPHERCFFWDGNGDNPYRGMLAWADVILVSEDSVSMASEAISTGKPVYILGMEGGSKRFARFHGHLVEQGYARRFEGSVAPFSYTSPDDLRRAAEAVGFILHNK